MEWWKNWSEEFKFWETFLNNKDFILKLIFSINLFSKKYTNSKYKFFKTNVVITSNTNWKIENLLKYWIKKIWLSEFFNTREENSKGTDPKLKISRNTEK